MISKIKSFKVKLLPNNKQKTKMFQFAGAARFAYNWALEQQMKSIRETGKILSNSDLRKEFTKLKNYGEKPWLCGISNDVMKQAIKDCCKAFSRFNKRKKQKGYVPFSKKKLAHFARIGKEPTVYDMNGHPKFKSKKKQQFKFYQDTAKIRFIGTHVKLECIADSKKKNRQRLNWIKLSEKNRIPTNARYANPRISFDGENWWISISILSKFKPMPSNLKFSRKITIKRIRKKTEGLGIDLGVKDLAICSDSTKIKNINKSRIVRKLEKTRCGLQRQVSRKYQMNKKGESYCKTSNIAKSESRLRRINHRLTNIRQNHVHQATTAIIKREPSFICLEDLNVIGMMKNKHLSKSVQNQKLREFRRQIEYKAKWNGIPVVIADRFYPSSKACVCCGNIKKDLKLSDRIYRCENCGNVIDRDFQAALNLKHYGEQMIDSAA